VHLAEYNYDDELKEDKVADSLVRMGEKKHACRLLVGKPEGDRPL
jgi:hypothetical protein